MSSDSQIPDIPKSAIIGLKIERTCLAFVYLVMLVMACCNIWNYLIKKKMWKSYPMSFAYFILVLYSSSSMVYELYMCNACIKHDCMAFVQKLDHDCVDKTDPMHKNDKCFAEDTYMEDSQALTVF